MPWEAANSWATVALSSPIWAACAASATACAACVAACAASVALAAASSSASWSTRSLLGTRTSPVASTVARSARTMLLEEHMSSTITSTMLAIPCQTLPQDGSV